MELSIATLCDSASDYGGKLCILGAFDTIGAQGFPVHHPHCALALRVVFQPEDEGHHRLDIRLIDADGKAVMPAVNPEIRVKFPPTHDDIFISRNLVLNFQPLTLPQPGFYSFDIKADDRLLGRVPLRAVTVRNPQSPPKPAPGE